MGRRSEKLKFSVGSLSNGKVVFLHRDPLDTVVSNFMQAHYRELPTFTPGQKFRLFFEGRLPPSSIDRFSLSARHGVEKICIFNMRWHEQVRRMPAALVLRYEAIMADTAGEIGKVIRFLRPDILPDIDMEDLVRRSSFAAMKRLEINGGDRDLNIWAVDPKIPQSFKVRQGEIGGYKKELHPQTIERARIIMDKLDYSAAMES
jgi:hypothetical protein